MVLETDTPKLRTGFIKTIPAQTIHSQVALAEDLPDYMQLSSAASWLRFPRKIELEFRKHYYISTIQTTRWAFIAGFVLYSLFGYLDLYVAPVSLKAVWFIRFVISCPVLIVIVVCSLFIKLRKMMQLLSAVAATVGGLGIVAMIMVTKPGEVANTHYYSGLLLFMLFTSSWLRLRFWYALATNTIVMICYELIAVYDQHLLNDVPGQVQFLSNNFILIASYLVGAFANYSLERHTRINFLQKRTIEAEKNKVNTQRIAIEQQANDLTKAITRLKDAQARLVNSEKLASLGELTAGIAHEIKNPLNFITNFSEVNIELMNDFEHEMEIGNTSETATLAKNIKDNLEKISYHSNRADSIVKNMLQHSRKSTGEKLPIEINLFLEEYVRLSYQGLRVKHKNFHSKIELDFDSSIKTINIVPEDMGRVILNLLTNAFYSVIQKSKISNTGYEPIVSIKTNRREFINDGDVKQEGICISIKDNGLGISEKAMTKIFQPFFTTKPAGEGVGLGLSLSHDIITKRHRGTIAVESKEGEFANFIIKLPIR